MATCGVDELKYVFPIARSARGLLAGGIAFVIAGWWFIRSAILYDGDFLGLRTRDEYAEMYAFKWLKPSSAPTWHNAGFSMWDMMTQTTYFLLLARSFVGMFEHMSLVLLPWMLSLIHIFSGRPGT